PGPGHGAYQPRLAGDVLEARINALRDLDHAWAGGAALADGALLPDDRRRGIGAGLAHAHQVVVAQGTHAALAAPGIDGEVVLPPGIVPRQPHPIPSLVLRTRMLHGVAVDVLPERALLAHRH